MPQPSREGSSRNHRHFICGSGFTRAFNRGGTIPENIDEEMLAKSLANKMLYDDSENDTRPFIKSVRPNLGVEQHFCLHTHIVDVSGHHELTLMQKTLSLKCRAEEAIAERQTKNVKELRVKPYTDSFDFGAIYLRIEQTRRQIQCAGHPIQGGTFGEFTGCSPECAACRLNVPGVRMAWRDNSVVLWTGWTLSGAEGIALLARQLTFALISGRTADVAMALYHPMQ
ncbi:hypothetical protein B0H13DRAFT_1864244 [Mycena leptocephala]|nr:hypothetical protein B0H13DRAFT_1864244 [Mycena leptocephala]